MSADPTIYCIEKVTDYLQFERLRHDLMVLEGYGSFEPLGGFKDKGRDAIHVSQFEGTTECSRRTASISMLICDILHA